MWKDIGYGVFECENCHRRITADKLPCKCLCEINPCKENIVKHPKNDFGTRLKALREEYKITREQVSEDLNLGKNSLYLYESGKAKPTISVTTKIADYFGVSIDYLACRTKKREVNK